MMYEGKEIRNSEKIRTGDLRRDIAELRKKDLEKRLTEGQRRYYAMDSGKRIEKILNDNYGDAQKEIRRKIGL